MGLYLQASFGQLSENELLVPPEASAALDSSKYDPVKQIHVAMPQATGKHFNIVLIPCLVNS